MKVGKWYKEGVELETDRQAVESWETKCGRTESEVGSGTGFIVRVGHVDALAAAPAVTRHV